MILGFSLMVAVAWIFRRATASKVDKVFRKGQLFSAAAFSLGHGGNDAQKTMGIITAVLTAGGIWGLSYGPNGELPHIPTSVVLSAHAAIALGTLVWWLANREDNGKPYHETEAGWRILCRDGGRSYARVRNSDWNSRIYNTHDHWIDCWRWSNSSLVSGEMGCRGKNRLGVGADNSCSCVDGSYFVLDCRSDS